MPANRKKQKKPDERTRQAARSSLNKQNRIRRARTKKKEGKSPWYIKAKLGNRLRRLNKKVLHAGVDRRTQIIDRIAVIERLLK